MTLVDTETFVASANGAPFLYGMHACTTPYYKIGFSRDPERRLAQVQALAPQPLRLVGMIPQADAAAEAEMHRRLRAYRHRGEWFNMERAATDLTLEVGAVVTPWHTIRFYFGFALSTSDGRWFQHREGWVA